MEVESNNSQEPNFRRKSLISNQEKYTGTVSFERAMFNAEYPDSHMHPSIQSMGDPYKNNLSNTLPTGNLLSRQKELQFRTPAAGIPSKAALAYGGESMAYNSTVDTRRLNRWDKAPSYLDDFNDRDSQQDFRSAGQPPLPMEYPSRQVKSAIRKAPATSILQQSGKLMMGLKAATAKIETQIGGGSLLSNNPIAGLSEGERKRHFFAQHYKQFAHSGEEGSMVEIAERSRSKSKRARLARLKKEAEEQQAQSLVDLMRSNQISQTLTPNPYASKQRYQYSKQTIHRSESPEFEKQDWSQTVKVVSPQRLGEPTPKITSIKFNYDQAGADSRQKKLQSMPYTEIQTLRQPLLAPPHPAPNPKQSIEAAHRESIRDSETANLRSLSQEKNKKQASLRSVLEQQISEKEERKREMKMREVEEEEKFMRDFNKYRFGALSQGGGSPMRNAEGKVITEHIPFTAQSQHNGGVEFNDREYFARGEHTLHIEPVHQSQPGVSRYGEMTFHDNMDRTNIKANMLDGHNFTKTLGTTASRYSPKKNEIAHMKPSNQFEDITEEEFNQREQNKNAYKHELFVQMEEAAQRKAAEKEKQRLLEQMDEEKIHMQLNQLREQYKKEMSPAHAKGSAPIYLGAEDPTSKAKIQSANFQGQKERSNSSLVRNVEYHNANASKERPAKNQQMSKQQSTEQVVQHQQPQVFSAQAQPVAQQYGLSMSDNAVSEQLQRLKRIQMEIEAKNQDDRNETQKIFKDLMESSKRFSLGISPTKNLYSSQSRGVPSFDPVSSFKSQHDLRIDSHYQQVSANPSIKNLVRGPKLVHESSFEPAPAPNTEKVKKQTEDLGNLDQLIQDFNQQFI